MLSRGQEVEAEFSEDDALDVGLSAGQMSLLHVNLVHGSQPNTSQLQRTGYVVRYVAPSVKQSGDQATGGLVRGEDHNGHYQLEGPPEALSPEEALARMKSSAREQLASVMKDTKGAGDDA